jgi:hypothetical protein
MLVLRGTKKLRDRIKGPAARVDDVSSTVLGDWFATALFWKPQVALLVNQRTLLPVFMPLAPAATLVTRVPAAIATALRNQGASEEFIAAELAAMGEVRIAPTNDRSTLGVMNEFAFHGDLHVHEGLTDLEALSFRLSSLILGPLHHRHGSPDDELAALLHRGQSNVVELHPRPAPTAVPRAGNQAHVFQLKVTLLGIKPPVWRRIVVDASTPIDRLHEYIQAAFGWWNYHLYEFEIDGKRYGIPDPDWDFGPPTKHATRTKLGNVADVGDSFTYSYDFGDGWEHRVTVEKSIPIAAGMTVPACTDGRRACPPEDCGGPWGYEEFLRILADPSHREHEERVLWAGGWGGGRLDPEAFDPSEFEDNLDLLRNASLD